MVLCQSRMLYVEFTLAETMEHFLSVREYLPIDKAGADLLFQVFSQR